MNLVKTAWNLSDKQEFSTYLQTFSKGKESCEFEKRILNTSLNCIAVPSKTVNFIVKEISKGNYLSFINLNCNSNWTEVAITGKLISKINDFSTLKRYLNAYLDSAESWATIDLLKFKVTPKNAENFLSLAKEYAVSNKPFVRRTAIIILFSFINLPCYDSEVFSLISSLKTGSEYYVNMAVAWLTCEYFIKRKSFAVKILTSNILNDFTQNKAISKCRDSFRVSKEDKTYLLNLKR